MHKSKGKTVSLRDIIKAIEDVAPLSLQESWDNSGLQIGCPDMSIEGVLTAVDVTPEVVAEAAEKGANLIVSHHPLIFGGLKNITCQNRTQRAVYSAIRKDIAVYSCHTPLDKAHNGLSWQVAYYLGLKPLKPLVPSAPGEMTGLGVTCHVEGSPEPKALLEKIRAKFPNMRHSQLSDGPKTIDRVAICTGSGGSLMSDVLAQGCTMYITGDLKHHDFVDYADRVVLVDCGHYETEMCAKYCLNDIVRDAFPELSVNISQNDKNSIVYN